MSFGWEMARYSKLDKKFAYGELLKNGGFLDIERTGETIVG